MPVYAKAMATKHGRKESAPARAAEPVEEASDEEESELGSMADEADLSDEEESVAESGDSDDDEEVAMEPTEDVEADAEADAGVNVEFTEPKAWLERMTLSAAKPLPADLDPNDDPKREEVFLKHAVLSVRRGIAMLERAGVKWRRPADYYAEMYKTDMHMEKVRAAMERSRKEVHERAHRRNMREQKKFGKEVQADVLKQRAQAKNTQMEKLAAWRKTKGKNGAGLDEVLNEEDDNNDSPAIGGKKGARRAAFRGAGKGGAAASKKRNLRPGQGKAGKKKQQRPGKSRRR